MRRFPFEPKCYQFSMGKQDSSASYLSTYGKAYRITRLSLMDDCDRDRGASMQQTEESPAPRRRCCPPLRTVLTLFSALVVVIWVLLRDVSRVTHDRSLIPLHHAWLASAERYAVSLGYQLGNAGIVPEQAWDYLDAVRRRNATDIVVCETGFFQGISAHLWLSASVHTRLHSFDLKFPKQAVTALRAAFGRGRLRTYEGPTARTLRQFRPDAPCDIISVDGSHEGWEPYRDLVALLPRARCGAVVFFDDTFDDRTPNKTLDNDPSHASFYNACTASYWRAVREGLLNHAKCTRLGWSLRWGRYPKGHCEARRTCAREQARGAGARGPVEHHPSTGAGG